MPELPEVETVRRGLVDLIGRAARIDTVELRRRDLRRPVPGALPQRLAGRGITSIDRRGKFLLWRLDDGGVLINHLGMSGSWRSSGPDEERVHDHCIVHLADGRRLTYHDPRRFGLLDYRRAERLWQHPFLHKLGPEPLAADAFTPAWLHARCAGSTAPIKNRLMDASVVVGVGNIYACESLHRAGIRPQRQAGRISRERLAALQQAVVAVLREAIDAGGSTIRDFRQAGGSDGYFQHRFLVYGRAGQRCKNCGATLKNTPIAGRPTVWCTRCQR